MQNEKSHLLRAMDCFTEGVMLLNVTTDDFKIIFLNDAWARITGAVQRLQGAGSVMPVLWGRADAREHGWSVVGPDTSMACGPG